MLIRLKIIIALCLALFSVYANSLSKTFHEPSSTEITVSDLNWQMPDQLPQDIRKSMVYRNWLHSVNDEPPAWFTNIDVDGNLKTRELLIASSLSGAGGRNFLLIAKAKSGQWSELASIFGAPILMKTKPTGYAELQTYHRNGLELWMRTFKISNGKYIIQTEALIPRAIVTESFYQRWLQLNLIESSQNDEAMQKNWKIKNSVRLP